MLGLYLLGTVLAAIWTVQIVDFFVQRHYRKRQEALRKELREQEAARLRPGQGGVFVCRCYTCEKLIDLFDGQLIQLPNPTPYMVGAMRYFCPACAQDFTNALEFQAAVADG